jgi:hypothetical protein
VRYEPIYQRWFHPEQRFFPAVPSAENPWTDQTNCPAQLDPELHRSMTAGRLNPWLYEQAQLLPGMLTHDFSMDGEPTRYLRRIAGVCRVGGANFLVAYVPFYGVASPRYSPALKQLGMAPAVADALASDPIYRRQNWMLRRECADLNLTLADTTEALVKAEAAGVPQFWSYDSHPCAAGYATIAVEIHAAWQKVHPQRGTGSRLGLKRPYNGSRRSETKAPARVMLSPARPNRSPEFATDAKKGRGL